MKWDEATLEAWARKKARNARRRQRYRDAKRRPKWHTQMPPEGVTFLEEVKEMRVAAKGAQDFAAFGKFSPEAKRFAVRRIDQLVSALEGLRRNLAGREG